PAGFPQEPKAFQVDDLGNPPRHINLNWLAMQFPLGEHKYTVAYLEDPALPKPSLYSERPYGRFGAFFKAAIVEKPLRLRYRLFVSEGKTPSQSELQSRYDQFTQELKKQSAE